MGYTHYWQRPGVIADAFFQLIKNDFEKLILPLSDAGIELAGGLGEGIPEITDDVIRFNGLNECGHAPTDDLVIPYPSASVLLIAKHHLRDQFVVHSNGGEAQWSDAKRICQQRLGYGDWFGIVEDRVEERWPGAEGPTVREVLLRTLVEIEPPKLA